MEFTIEKLEKIILEAPFGCHVFTTSDDWGGNKRLVGSVVYTDKNGCIIQDLASSSIRVGDYLRTSPSGWFFMGSIESIAEQLQEMKMKEEAKEVEWDGKGLPPVGAEFVSEPCFDVLMRCKYSSKWIVVGEMIQHKKPKGMEAYIDLMRQPERTFRKPLTAEQKQAQIDEKNGELLRNEFVRLNPLTDSRKWAEINDDVKMNFINLAKQIDFTGKLSA